MGRPKRKAPVDENCRARGEDDSAAWIVFESDATEDVFKVKDLFDSRGNPLKDVFVGQSVQVKAVSSLIGKKSKSNFWPGTVFKVSNSYADLTAEMKKDLLVANSEEDNNSTTVQASQYLRDTSNILAAKTECAEIRKKNRLLNEAISKQNADRQREVAKAMKGKFTFMEEIESEGSVDEFVEDHGSNNNKFDDSSNNRSTAQIEELTKKLETMQKKFDEAMQEQVKLHEQLQTLRKLLSREINLKKEALLDLEKEKSENEARFSLIKHEQDLRQIVKQLDESSKCFNGLSRSFELTLPVEEGSYINEEDAATSKDIVSGSALKLIPSSVLAEVMQEKTPQQLQSSDTEDSTLNFSDENIHVEYSGMETLVNNLFDGKVPVLPTEPSDRMAIETYETLGTDASVLNKEIQQKPIGKPALRLKDPELYSKLNENLAAQLNYTKSSFSATNETLVELIPGIYIPKVNFTQIKRTAMTPYQAGRFLLKYLLTTEALENCTMDGTLRGGALKDGASPGVHPAIKAAVMVFIKKMQTEEQKRFQRNQELADLGQAPLPPLLDTKGNVVPEKNFNKFWQGDAMTDAKLKKRIGKLFTSSRKLAEKVKAAQLLSALTITTNSSPETRII